MLGPNLFLDLPVPASNGESAPVDVSAFASEKTFVLFGNFRGEYVILGSHGGRFTPIAFFSFTTKGEGPKSIKIKVDATIRFLKIRRDASHTVKIALAGNATCACA
jgi:hypothetical protein